MTPASSPNANEFFNSLLGLCSRALNRDALFEAPNADAPVAVLRVRVQPHECFGVRVPDVLNVGASRNLEPHAVHKDAILPIGKPLPSVGDHVVRAITARTIELVFHLSER